MPGQKITLSPRGLFTNVNSLGKIPEGGLLRADNVVISRPGILESRRGATPAYFPSNKEALRIFNAKLRVGGSATNGWLGTATAGMVIIQSGSGNNLLWTPDGVTFTTILPIAGQSSFPLSPVDGDRHYYGFEQNGIIYLASAEGIVAIGRPLPNSYVDDDDLAHSGYYMAGVPFGLSASAEVQDPIYGEPAGTALDPDSQAAYYFTFGYRDSSGIPHLGAPTTRAVAINPVGSGETGVAKNVKVKTTIPPGIIKSRNFWQLYRTLRSPSADVDPGTDAGLIYEGEVPSDNVITNVERTDNIVTAVTESAHGYSLGQEFNLTQAVAGANTPAEDAFLAIAITAYPGTTRTVWKKVGNEGTWAATSFTFDIAGVTETDSGDVKYCKLFATDPVTKLHYYIEKYSPFVYILDINGKYLGNINIKCVPDLACYDEETRMIHILARPKDSVKTTFDYTSANNADGAKYIRVSTRNNNVAASVKVAELPGAIETPWVNPAPVRVKNVALQVGRGFMGTWRARPNASLWTVIAFASDGRKPIVIATNSSGSSWKSFDDIGPNYSSNTDNTGDSWNVFGTCYYRVTAGTSFTVGSGDYEGETQSAFVISGIATAPTTFVAPETVGPAVAPESLVNYTCHYSHAEYLVANDGNDEPAIYSDTGNPFQSTKQDTNNVIGYWNLPTTYGIGMTSEGVFMRLFYIISDAGVATKWAWAVTEASMAWKVLHNGGGGPLNELAPANDLWLSGAIYEGYDTGIYGNAAMIFAVKGAQTNSGVYPAIVEGVITPASPAEVREYILGDNLTPNPPGYDQCAPITSNNALVNSQPVKFVIPEIEGGIPVGTYTITEILSATSFKFRANGSDIGSTAVSIPIVITSISFLDTVAPDFIGPYLYTSTVEEGAIAANYPPPVSKDIALFRTYAFYANCTQPASVQITMLNVDLSNGVKIKLAGNAYAVAGDEEDVINKVFKVYRGHLAETPTATLADDIQSTIASLANVVNANYADFLNVIIPIGTNAVSFASFFVRSVNITNNAEFHFYDAGDNLLEGYFTPYDIIVAAESVGNVLYYSKTNIPDAVPLLNSIRIGADSKPIRRIVPARDCLFVFKDDGCFILRGYGPPWQVDPFDLTLQIACQDSLVTLDNSVYGLFTRGCFKVSDANVELLSLPIQNLLERYMAGDNKDVGNSYGFGTADNPDHKYILWLPDQDTTGNSDIGYVFDTFTEAWTKAWVKTVNHVICYKETKLVFADYADVAGNDVAAISVEQRSLTDADLNDGKRYLTATIGAGSLMTVTATDAAHRLIRLNCNVTEGDSIKSTTSDWQALALASASAGTWFEVSAEPPASLTSVEVYRGIEQVVNFAPTFPTSPAASNHFSEYALSFRRAYWGDFLLTVERPIEESDLAQSVGIIPFDGLAHFGIQVPPLLTRIAERNFLRTYVPRDQQRATLIIPGYSCRVANNPCEVDGIYIVMTPGPTSFTRR